MTRTMRLRVHWCIPQSMHRHVPIWSWWCCRCDQDDEATARAAKAGRWFAGPCKQAMSIRRVCRRQSSRVWRCRRLARRIDCRLTPRRAVMPARWPAWLRAGRAFVRTLSAKKSERRGSTILASPS